MHRPTGVVGQLQSFDSVAGTVKLSTGDVFLAQEGNFVTLTPAEVTFSRIFDRVLAKVLEDGLALAVSQKIDLERARRVVMGRILVAQREVERAVTAPRGAVAK